MATTLTHSVLGLIAAKTTAARRATWRFVLVSAVCSAFPDIDMWGRQAGIPYGHVLGHRGFFHSPFFALLLSVLVVTVFLRKGRPFSMRRMGLVVYFFLLTASHGLIDAMTSGGMGVAFLAPFSNTRYLIPWQPIQAAPFGLGIFSPAGQQALADELAWVLFPAMLVWLAFSVCRNILTKED